MNYIFKQQSVGETTYLIYELDNGIEIDSFAMHMMSNNKMVHIVPVQIVSINEKRQLQFNVTGLTKLSNRVAIPRTKKEILEILSSIVNIFEEADAYMLDLTHLLLEWEHVYLDGYGNCMLIYLPIECTNDKEQISFLQEIVSRIQLDYQEKDPYLFDLLNAFSRGAIRKLSDFKEILKKNAGVMRQESKQVEEKINFEEQKLERSVQKEESEKKDSVLKIAERGIRAKPQADSKIPIINIPGREPGGKEICQIPIQAPEKPKKDGGKRKMFALPKKQKLEKAPLVNIEEKANEDQKNRSSIIKVEKNEMYEGYENTVIMQEPAETRKRDEETVMLEEMAFMPQASARLIRKQDGTVYRIDKERIVIGSGTMADICICHNNAISRSHVTISCIGGSYYIEDNRSKNGTFINGRRLQTGVQEPLYDGMIVRFANEDFEFSKE